MYLLENHRLNFHKSDDSIHSFEGLAPITFNGIKISTWTEIGLHHDSHWIQEINVRMWEVFPDVSKNA